MESKEKLLEAIEDLRGYDHAFITPEGAQRLAAPFDVKAKTYIAKADPTNPKGLTFHDGRTEAEGIDAALLAEQICGKLGVEYEGKFGRGSQLRACCDALEAWVKGREE